MKAAQALLVFLVSTCASLSTASGQDGNWYLDACRNFANDNQKVPEHLLFRQAACAGSIAALGFVAPGMKAESLRSCTPEGVKSRQMAKAVVEYLDKNPAKLHEPFAVLALLG